jgi:mono/diheme cytochrome c family protein
MRRFAVAAIASLCWTAAVHADEKAPDVRDPKLIAAGHKVFLEKQCAHCHGEDGNGGINLTRRKLTDAKYVFEAISDGREKNGIRMPAWRDVLSDQEIWEAAAYVLSIQAK